MTATIEGPAKAGTKASRTPGKRATAGLVPSRPQVNLLPPEVHAARNRGRVKRWLALVVVLAVLGAAAAVVLAVLAQAAANDELAQEKARTESLLAEQQEYAEVPLVLSQLDAIKEARELGMSTEVLWADQFVAVLAALPPGTTIDSVMFTAAPPMEPTAPPTNPLDAQAVGSITFLAATPTVPDTAQWIENLSGIPGLANPWFSNATIVEEDEQARYAVTGTVQVMEAARAQRFATTEGEDS